LAQWPRSTSSLWRTSSGLPNPCHRSAYSAVVRRVRVSPPPPISIGSSFAIASEVVIPLQCEYLALEGLGQLLSAIGLIRENLNPALEVSGVVLTMYDRRTNLCLEVERDARDHLAGRVYETVVPRNVRLSEAPSHGLPIALYSPSSRGAEAYRNLAAEFRARRSSPAYLPAASTFDSAAGAVA